MSTLKENLALLAEDVPALGNQLAAVARLAEVFAQLTADAATSCHHKAASAERVAPQLEAVLGVVVSQAQREQHLLEDELQDLHARVDRALAALRQAAADFESASDGTAAALGTLDEQLTDGRERLAAAHATAREASQQLGERLRQAEAELQDPVEALATELHTSAETVAPARSALDTAVDTLADAFTQAAAAAEQQAMAAEVAREQWPADHDSWIDGALATLAHERAQHVEGVAAHLDTQVRQAVGGELTVVAGRLETLGRQIEQQEGETHQRRAQLATAVAAAADRLPALHQGVEQVHVAAAKVGIPWP